MPKCTKAEPEKEKGPEILEIQGFRALCEEGDSNPHGC
jgi:hypothetical protein